MSCVRSASRSSFLFERDLFGKPDSTFPDHALGSTFTRFKVPGETSVSNSRSDAEKRQTFRKLHEAGCFVIPNPWNVGSARYLQGLGFKALATTSSGHAHSRRATPTARRSVTTCWRITASSWRRPTFR